MEKWGWGLSRKELLEVVVVDYIKANNTPNSFKSEVPREDRFLGFKKRNNMSIKKSQSAKYARRKTDMVPFIMFEYYDLLKRGLDEKGSVGTTRPVFFIYDGYQ